MKELHEETRSEGYETYVGPNNTLVLQNGIESMYDQNEPNLLLQQKSYHGNSENSCLPRKISNSKDIPGIMNEGECYSPLQPISINRGNENRSNDYLSNERAIRPSSSSSSLTFRPWGSNKTISEDNILIDRAVPNADDRIQRFAGEVNVEI